MEQIAAEKRHQEEKEGKYQAELQDLHRKVSVLQKERQRLDELVQDCHKELEDNKSEKVNLKSRYINILGVNITFISE